MSDGKTLPSYDTCKEVTDICRVEFTVYGELFTKGACIFFAGAYLLLLVTQIFFGIKAKTWSFMIWLALGTGFEMVGYAARTIMADNPWKMNAFIAQYLTLLLGPTLVAAAVSITFKHIVLWYGEEWSVMRPKLYPWVFVGMDILSILIQVVGGGIMTMNTTGDGGSKSSRKLAEVLLIGGVSFQVANMICCAGLMLVYWRRRKKSLGLVGSHARLGSSENFEENNLIPGKIYPPSHQSPEVGGRVRLFVRVVAVAYLAIIIRCCYRVPEMIPSMSQDLMRNETLFLILDGGMILLAVGSVTIFHPCVYFPFMGKKWVRAMVIPQTHLQPGPYEPSQSYGRPGAYEMGRMP